MIFEWMSLSVYTYIYIYCLYIIFEVLLYVVPDSIHVFSLMVVSSAYVAPYHHKSESKHHPSIVPNTSLVRVTYGFRKPGSAL